ncbi:MAG TPA: hypothetical protein VLD86_02050, partial [Ilumatobacteraceae bacterium]|nr:hypothetical protein [Ilumatobacteraceae bacterium]
DPGTWNEYTTLELEWDGGGVPMRILMYFASDGTDWWATELRTYDGSADPKWIEMPGEFFRSPLGTAWQGDLDVQSLHVHGLKLQAFVRPAACGSATEPLALIADYPTIDGISAPAMGFGGSVTLLDTATCAPTSFTGVEFSVTSRDETVARIERSEAYGTGGFRFELSFPTPGTTTVRVAVSEKATGELIDQVDIPVTASAGDGPNLGTPPQAPTSGVVPHGTEVVPTDNTSST